MASAVSANKFLSDNFIDSRHHDPGGTGAVICSPDGGTTKRVVDMSLFEGFVAGAHFQAGTGGVTKVEIVAAEDEAMATNLTVIKDSGTIDLDAEDDRIYLECTAAEIAQLGEASGYALRYAAARLTCADAADEAVVTYIGLKPRFAYNGLSTATRQA